MSHGTIAISPILFKTLTKNRDISPQKKLRRAFLGKKRVLKVPSQYSQQNHFIRSQNLPQKKMRRVFLGEKRVLKVPSQFLHQNPKVSVG